MGKLRDSLTALNTLVEGVSKTGNNAIDEVTGASTNVKSCLERTFGGYEVLAMYLKQKALKEKKDVKAWNDDPIKQHLDSEIADYIRGIEMARGDAVKAYTNWEHIRKLRGDAVNADLDRVNAVAALVEKTIEIKRAKWLQTKDYKNKIDGYAQTLKDIKLRSERLRSNVDNDLGNTESGGHKQFDDLKMTVDTTIKAINAHAQIGLNSELKKLVDTKSAEILRKGFEDYGAQIKQIRAWLSEADNMEQAADDVNIDAKATIEHIIVKSGSSEIGRGTTGVFERTSKLLTISELTWKGPKDPLSYLQHKVTVFGKFKAGTGGDFMDDMKIDKIGADLKKVTLKGV